MDRIQFKEGKGLFIFNKFSSPNEKECVSSHIVQYVDGKTDLVIFGFFHLFISFYPFNYNNFTMWMGNGSSFTFKSFSV